MVDTYAQSQPIINPNAQTAFVDPAVEQASRNLLASYFGPGGLMSQPIPIPTRQVAGLSPLEIEARNLAGGLGGFAGQLGTAQDLYQSSASAYNPLFASQFMNPYTESVIQTQQADVSRLGEDQKRQARARQAQSGAFGGSRGALQEAQINRDTLREQSRIGADLRNRGFTSARDASMRAFEDAQRRQAGAASGIAGLARQGQDMLTGQIGTLTGLGATGRGIQDRALGYGYDAATQMADEPFMRFQRGQAALQGLAPFLPTYQSGYGTGSQGLQNRESRNILDRFIEIDSLFRDLGSGGGILDLILGRG